MRLTNALIALVLTTSVIAAPAPQLQNEKISVTFSQSGLAEIYDRTLNRRFRFAADQFSITIDGEYIDSAELSPITQTPIENGREFVFKSGQYNIKVAYELKPNWRFVTKQLFVTGKPDFFVNEVQVFRCQLHEPVLDQYIAKSSSVSSGRNDYGAFLRLPTKPGETLVATTPGVGMFVLVQNPFLTWQRQDGEFSITYPAEIAWKSDYGPFPSDRGCIGTYKLTGRHLPAQMVPEWKMADDPQSPGDNPGMDQAEVAAFSDCVQQFILPAPGPTAKVHVPWCENDYQIDIATPEGQAEYKRVIDQISDLGCTHMLFTCGNSAVSDRADCADDWSWEYVTWLGLGKEVRKGTWDPTKDALPESIQMFLEYAKTKGIKLMAYVYPVLPYLGNEEWLVRKGRHRKKLNASLGVRSFQDWLIENMVAFYRNNGLGGFSFDYTFLWYEGTSYYAQWFGWRRVLEELRRQLPDAVIDGRQSYHRYGPWIWLAGSYPHPTAADEQPESFRPFPDLHFDRCSANRQRYTAWWYRNREFCPVQLMPGFITHQTARHQPKELRDIHGFRRRDWDYLGWKYSLISSIATGPFNNVVDMVPARDIEEYKHFSDADKTFFRNWLEWTDENTRYLKNTRTIIGHPALGCVDGTAAIDGDRGYIFLFNPNHRKRQAEFSLDDSIGLTGGESFILRQIYPREMAISGTSRAIAKYGHRVCLPISGTTAMVLQIAPAGDTVCRPILFNAPGNVSLEDDKLVLTDVKGQVGSEQNLLVVVPKQARIKRVTVNGKRLAFSQSGEQVSINAAFAGAEFTRNQQVGNYDTEFAGGKFTGTFVIPERIFKQLAQRKRDWPIPYTAHQLETPWLGPDRLLLYVQIAEPDAAMEAQLKLDGQKVELRKAFTAVYPRLQRQTSRRTFVGFYADVSSLAPNRQYNVELTLPGLKPGQFQGLFFENVEDEYTTEIVQ